MAQRDMRANFCAGLLLQVLVLLGAPCTLAQQKPFVSVKKFDDAVSYRTNVCSRQQQLWNDSLALPDALRGLNLTAALTNYRYPNEDAFFTLVDGKIKEQDPGLFAVIMDEVARRAGFEWRNSFAVFDPLNSTTDGDAAWADILEWSVDVFDISVEKWGRSVERMARGISFPRGWWESSIVLGERLEAESSSKRVVDLWSFLKPFTAAVWIAICGAIVFSGIIYLVLEYLDVTKELGDDTFLECIFHSAFTFTGHFSFEPHTRASQILGFSWAFWALLVGAAYTANMASFLVSPRVTVYKYSTVENVLARNGRVCVQANTIHQEILEKNYPELRLVPKYTEQGIFDGLREDGDGGCDAIAHQIHAYELYERSKNVNYDCSISSEKRVVEIVEAGMATALDTGVNKCTSLISHVLDYYLAGMIDDGFIQQAWAGHLRKLATIDCIPDVNQGKNAEFDETFRLTLQEVGGIFILHLCATGLAMALAIYQFRNRKDGRTLGTAFGITQAKKAIGRRLSVASPSTR